MSCQWDSDRYYKWLSFVKLQLVYVTTVVSTRKEKLITSLYMCLQYCVSVTILDLKVHKYNQWGGGGGGGGGAQDPST